MQEMIQNPPRTILEVFKMLPEGTRAELIEGILYMSPAPFLDHQDASITIGSLLFTFVRKQKLGRVFAAPIDVFLDHENVFQPDIIFVSKSNQTILRKEGVFGAPDLVIEILSPGTRKFDLVKKKKIYEKSGVKEYWVVDPATKECTGFQLIKGEFSEFKKEKGNLQSLLLKHTFKF
jgi:Uma2 family endonuclease